MSAEISFSINDKIDTILTDIEGTTTSISFVKVKFTTLAKPKFNYSKINSF
jgi:methionine salvage enolase-phosphatase E1